MTKSAFYHFTAASAIGARVECAKLAALEDACAERARGGYIWLAFVSPKREELAAVIPALGIHPLSIDDCFDDDQIPKVDVFPDYAEILFNDFSLNDGIVRIEELNLFVGSDFIVTVFDDETDARCGIERIAESVCRANVNGLTGPARILHAILDAVVDRKFSVLDAIGDKIIDLEDTIVSGKGSLDASTLHGIRRDLAIMRKSLFNERELLARICRKESGVIPDDAIIYFSDVYDHLAKYVGIVETNREMVTNLAQLGLTIASNAMAEASNRTNRSMTRLTFITTIFMPLTLIAGIGGMSEWTMITGQENWKFSYPILLGAMALTGFVNYLVLRHLDRHS